MGSPMSSHTCRTGLAAWTHRLKGEEGSALIEFAVSMPLLALLVMAGSGTLMIIQARFAAQTAAREAALIGANVSTSIDPYDTAIGAALDGAERVLVDHGLDIADATITFDGTSPALERGGLFRVQVDYDISIPLPSSHFIGRGAADGTIFTVRAISVVPIQQYKARWPCPSPDPLCS